MERGYELGSQMRLIRQPKCFLFARMHLQEYSLKRVELYCENSKNYEKIKTLI
jgi:hypothetical protein